MRLSYPAQLPDLLAKVWTHGVCLHQSDPEMRLSCTVEGSIVRIKVSGRRGCAEGSRSLGLWPTSTQEIASLVDDLAARIVEEYARRPIEFPLDFGVTSP